MNNQDYLDQITASAQARPVDNSNRLLSPLMIKIIVGGVALTIIIIIIGVILGNINGQASEMAKRLSVRMTNVSATITTYNPSIRSSTLRQHGTQVQSTLKNTQKTLGSFLEQNYGYTKPDEKSQMYLEEKATIDEVNKTLEHAKLNAYLDRIYVSELSHQVELMMIMSADIYKQTDNDELKNIAETTANNLYNAYESLKKDTENIK